MTQEYIDKIAEQFEYTDGIYGFKQGFKQGIKLAQKEMFSEEEVKKIIEATLIEYSDFVLADIPDWFEKFKK